MFESQARAVSGVTVLAVGVFDLFHIGHLRYLQYARQQGSALIVGVMPDRTAGSLKAKRPVIDQDQRLEIVAGLACVTEALLMPTATTDTHAAAGWIPGWSVHHVVAGGGWQGSERWLRLAPLLQMQGIAVSFAPQTEGISTTDLVARIRAPLRAAPAVSQAKQP